MGMWLLRMLYLQILCLQYLFKDSLSAPPCTSYVDLEGKRGTNCSHRSLVSVPHPLPPDTEILLLNYNNLSSVPLTSFQSLPYLKDLDLSHNQIQHFDLVSLLPLEKLDISSNSLTGIPDFKNLRNLKKLVLDHNQIPDLPERAFDVLVSLEELSVKGNAIRVIPDGIFDQLEELTRLTLSGNRIERFPGNFLQGPKNLDTFDISNNNLSSFPRAFENIFAPYIYIYNNPWHCDCDTVENFTEWIRNVDGSIYDSIGLSDSKSVVCSSPPGWKTTPIVEFPLEQICHVVTTIRTAPQMPTGTERSHISTSTLNLFKTSPPPELCASYTDLEGKRGTNCSHRSLVSIPHPLPTDTEILLLNYNNLSSVPLTSFQSLPHLKGLDLSHNQIQHFDPDSPLALEKLDLSSNSLTGIPEFKNLRNLRKLVLDHNQIPDLPERAFDLLVSLEELRVKGNAIRVIPDGIFDSLGNLRHLILSGNRIERFPENSLRGAQNLDTFDISNNNLSSVPRGFENIFAPYIYLYNNPWHCDCDTVPNLIEWIQFKNGSIYESIGQSDSKSVVCSSPPGWKGTPIIEFPLKQICHVVTTIRTAPQTPTGTERSHISTSTVNLFKTSPPPEICASYTDLEGKRGTNCSHRSLVSVPHPLPTDTEILLLNYNNLSSVPLTSFQSLPHLKDLDLSHNQIQHFDPDSPLPLEKLDLSSNSLTGIPDFRNLRNLRKLVLDHNQIPDLPERAFDVLVSLEALSVKGNAIRVIPDGIFDSLGNLRHLILPGNRIERFPNNSLHSLRNLTTLDISNNQIRTIPREIFGINPAFCLLLSGNPLHCNCDVEYLMEWMELMERAMSCGNGTFDDKGIICNTPISMEGRPLFQLSPLELCKSSTPGYGALTVRSSPQATSRSHPTSASPEDSVNRWGRMFGLLEALGPWGSSCYLLFLLHCLALALVLLANCLLLLSVARFHRRCLVPMRELARRPFGIKLVRYSLLLPDPRQIYPAPSPDGEPGGRERDDSGQLLDDDLTPSISGMGSPPPSGEVNANTTHMGELARSASQYESSSRSFSEAIFGAHVANAILTLLARTKTSFILSFAHPSRKFSGLQPMTPPETDGNIRFDTGRWREQACPTEPAEKSNIPARSSAQNPLAIDFGILLCLVPTVLAVDGMWLLRMLYLQILCLQYLFKDSLSAPPCTSYIDLEGKRGTNCSHRSLVSIPHPLPPDTEILLLNYNKLSSVPLTSFQSLPYLKDLDLSHNQIQHFDLVSLLPLEKLDLSSNSLTGIPDFKNLRNLRKLVLDHNQIPDLPERAFDVLVSLEELSVKGNAIRIIPDGIFDQLEELSRLILSGNRIERFPGNSLQGAQNLDTFDISNNNLSSFPRGFENIFAPYIYLYNNPWHCDCDTVENFTEWMRNVDGSIYDSIGQSDSKSVVCSSPAAWKGIPIVKFPLEQICHVVTTIRTTPQMPTGTERSHISISTLNLFKTSPLPEICASYTDLEGKRGTNCSHRSLVSIPHPLPPDTEILLLNYNNLSSVPLTSFQSLPYLKDLDLSHNQIQHFDLVSLLPLEKLDLSSNSLTRIPDFKNLRNLKKLVLDHNQIPDLPERAFDVLVSLEALSIKGNAIRVIPDGIFDSLGNLRHLILSGNRIERFPGNSLQGAQNLDTFDISNNNLSSVPRGFENIFAPYIYLYNNPWHCDCDTVPNLIEWIQFNDGSIYDSIGQSDSKSVVCSSPPGWKGIPIVKFPLEQICHIVTTIRTAP
ncbi:uncharacterized protein LOC144481626 [Mustelus asterias]